MFTQSNMRHPCSSMYLYRCDDSLSNSKDASLNKGLDYHRIIDLFINNDINCQILICPNVSAEKSDLGTDAGGGLPILLFRVNVHTNTTQVPDIHSHLFCRFFISCIQRVQTTFVIDFDFCLGGRAQQRILACMWQSHLNQMLQTEPCLSVVMNEITCMITVLLRFIF